MKKKSSAIMLVVGTAMLGGCVSAPQSSQSSPFEVRPFSAVQDAIASADGYYQMGRQLQRAGRYDEAERAYQRALDMDPGHIEARNGMAAVTAARGDLDLAIALLERLARENPDRSHVLANLGYAHYLKGNDFEARVALEQAVALDPSNQSAQTKLKRVMERIDAAGRTVTTDPAMAQAPVVNDVPVVVELAPGVLELKRPSYSVPPVPETAPLAVADVGAPAPAPAPVHDPAERPGVVMLVRSDGVSAPQEEQAAQPVEVVAIRRLEIVNGNGVTGLARSLRNLMAGTPWTVSRVRNNGQFNVHATRIEYPEGYGEAARKLASDLGLEPVYRPTGQLANHMRVVLGYDLRSLDALRSRLQVAAATLSD